MTAPYHDLSAERSACNYECDPGSLESEAGGGFNTYLSWTHILLERAVWASTPQVAHQKITKMLAETQKDLIHMEIWKYMIPSLLVASELHLSGQTLALSAVSQPQNTDRLD